MDKKEAEVQGVEIGDKVYCPYCAEETRRSSYGQHQNIDGYIDYCSCDGALKNDQFNDELIRNDRASEKIKRKQSEIPTAMDKLNKLRFQEAVKRAAIEFHQPLPD